MVTDPDIFDSSKFDNMKEYENMSFEKRLGLGLSGDRDVENFFAGLFPSVIKSKSTKDPTIFLEYVESTMYRTSRNVNSWHTKRQVNAKLVNLDRAHEHIINLSRPVLLDLLKQVQPTAKDWKELSTINQDDSADKSKIHEKSTRRTEEYYPHIVGELTGPSLTMRNEDGSVDEYPKRPNREDKSKNDKTLKNIATNYSLPPYRGMLDAKDFVDVNYLIRQKRFWKDMLSILSEILDTQGPIRKEMEWLVYHIVNNDIASHVLFDDLSTEYESRWFKQQTPEVKIQVAGVPGIQSTPYFFTRTDAKKGIVELGKFTKEFQDTMMPPILEKYKISSDIMKKRIKEFAIAAVYAYDYSGNYQQADFITKEIAECGL